MTVIEFIAGEIFILGMGIKLWDYSDRWGNIKGIICPLFSLIWTLVAVGFYFLIRPVCENLIMWYQNNAYTNISNPNLYLGYMKILLRSIENGALQPKKDTLKCP